MINPIPYGIKYSTTTPFIACENKQINKYQFLLCYRMGGWVHPQLKTQLELLVAYSFI